MASNYQKITPKLALIAIIAILLLLGLSLTGCTGFTIQERDTRDTIKIGLLGDLTGDYADFLKGITRGTQLAVDDLEAQGFDVKLIIGDQQSCDKKHTVSLMQKFVNIDDVDFIIGGSCSSTTLAAAPIAELSKTVMISPSSSAPSISGVGDYVFRTYITDNERSVAIARIAFQLGKRKIAIINDGSNDAFMESAKGLREEFIKLGGQIVIEEIMAGGEQDFRTALMKIKDKNPDALITNLGPRDLGLMAKQAKELNMDVDFFTPIESAEETSVIELAGKEAVEGLIYAMPGNPPETPALQTLQEKYKQRYGEDSLPSYTTEAYDAVMLGIKALKASDGSKEDIKNKLYEVSKQYTGVSGNVVFDSNGDVHKDILLKQIKNGEHVVYTR